MQTRKKAEKQKAFTTPKCRFAFTNVFEPKAFGNNPAKYSAVLLFDKKTDLKDMKQKALAAAVAFFGKKFEKRENWPEGFKWPFRDGDKKKGDIQGYKGCIFVAASSKYKPGVVRNDRERSRIDSDEEFYGGCYGRALLLAEGFDFQGNSGVKFYLQGIQKLADGERFGGGSPNLEDEFDYVEDEDGSSDSDDGDSTNSNKSEHNSDELDSDDF